MGGRNGWSRGTGSKHPDINARCSVLIVKAIDQKDRSHINSDATMPRSATSRSLGGHVGQTNGYRWFLDNTAGYKSG